MIVNVVVVEGGRLPFYKTAGAACADCFARTDCVIEPGKTVIVPLGIKVEVPEGYEIQVRPRSGLGVKGKVAVFGTIDSDYRGEVGAIMYNSSSEPFSVHKDDRIAQLSLSPVYTINWKQVDKLSETERGEGGFGHTGL